MTPLKERFTERLSRIFSSGVPPAKTGFFPFRLSPAAAGTTGSAGSPSINSSQVLRCIERMEGSELISASDVLAVTAVDPDQPVPAGETSVQEEFVNLSISGNLNNEEIEKNGHHPRPDASAKEDDEIGENCQMLDVMDNAKEDESHKNDQNQAVKGFCLDDAKVLRCNERMEGSELISASDVLAVTAVDPDQPVPAGETSVQEEFVNLSISGNLNDEEIEKNGHHPSPDASAKEDDEIGENCQILDVMDNAKEDRSHKNDQNQAVKEFCMDDAKVLGCNERMEGSELISASDVLAVTAADPDQPVPAEETSVQEEFVNLSISGNLNDEEIEKNGHHPSPDASAKEDDEIGENCQILDVMHNAEEDGSHKNDQNPAVKELCMDDAKVLRCNTRVEGSEVVLASDVPVITAADPGCPALAEEISVFEEFWNLFVSEKTNDEESKNNGQHLCSDTSVKKHDESGENYQIPDVMGYGKDEDGGEKNDQNQVVKESCMGDAGVHKSRDCMYYLRTGACKFGSNCRFNHPVQRKSQVFNEKFKEGKEFLDTTGQAECKYFLKTGGCKFGDGCRFNHTSGNFAATAVVDLNFLGLPIRPGEKECPYYMRNGCCKYDINCRFSHPEPTVTGGSDSTSGRTSESANISWHSSKPLNEIPPFVPTNLSSTSSNHEQSEFEGSSYWQQGSVYPPQAYIMNSSAVDEFPERPGQPECSYFLKTGTCKYKSTCKFHHPMYRFSKMPQCALPQCALSDQGLPLRPDQSTCAFYERYGICKFGPACKFNHPTNQSHPASSIFPGQGHLPSSTEQLW